MKPLSSIYLAAAIDLTRKGQFDPFQWLKDKLKPIQCFNPKAAFEGDFDRRSLDTSLFIAGVNFAALAQADVLIVYSDLKACSFGMPMEMLYAMSLDKPVVLVVPDEYKVGVYGRLFSHFIIDQDKFSLSSLELMLKMFNSAECPVYNERFAKLQFIKQLLDKGGK